MLDPPVADHGLRWFIPLSGNFTDPKITFFIIFSKKLRSVKKEIENRLLLLARETDVIFTELQSFEDDFLRKTGRGWSIIQVLSHLNMSESIALEYMKKKMKAGSEMSKVNVVNSLRMWVTRGFLQTGLKWRAPAYIANPNGEYALGEIKSTWETTRSNIRKYVEDYPDDLLNRAVYKHPMAGRLSLLQAVDSLIYHQRHHVHQINRIKKELQR